MNRSCVFVTVLLCTAHLLCAQITNTGDRVEQILDEVKTDAVGKPLSSHRNQFSALAALVIFNPKASKFRVIYTTLDTDGVKRPQMVEYDKSLKQCIHTDFRNNHKGLLSSVSEEAVVRFPDKNPTFWSEIRFLAADSTQEATKPAQNADNSVPIVMGFINKEIGEGHPVKILNWAKAVSVGQEWGVHVVYEERTAYGETVVGNGWFYVQSNKIVGAKMGESKPDSN